MPIVYLPEDPEDSRLQAVQDLVRSLAGDLLSAGATVFAAILGAVIAIAAAFVAAYLTQKAADRRAELDGQARIAEERRNAARRLAERLYRFTRELNGNRDTEAVGTAFEEWHFSCSLEAGMLATTPLHDTIDEYLDRTLRQMQSVAPFVINAREARMLDPGLGRTLLPEHIGQDIAIDVVQPATEVRAQLLEYAAQIY